MNDPIELILLGTPIPLARARFSKSGQVYNSQSREMLTNHMHFKQEWGDRSRFDDPIHIDLLFVFPVPYSYSKLRKSLLKNTFYNHRPDLDNLVKKILDELIGVCYLDDSIVVSIMARKIYGTEGKTIINIKRA